MPPTSEAAGVPDVRVTGLGDFGLEALEADVVRAAREAAAAQSLTPPDGAEISLTFVGDAAIAKLNRRWLGRSGPTDVISFGLGERPLVADVYVSVETARRNAGRYGVAHEEELLRLVVHGVLHAAGYDHPEGEQRASSEMFTLQEEVLARLLGGRTET